jgi:hypothetical protein
MRLTAAFALAALVPAALNAAPQAPSRLTVRMCGGNARTVDLPGPRPAHEGEDCPKACHASCSRKRPGERPA